MNLASNCTYPNAMKLNVKLSLTEKFYYASWLYFIYLSRNYNFSPRMNRNKFYSVNELKK